VRRIISEQDGCWPTDPSTIVVFSDLNCSFAHLAVHRLHRTRAQLGLEGRVWFDHRAFPLELFNRTVNERPGVDSEVAVVGALDPSAGWRLRQAPDWTYPVTMLPPLEAVQAAKSQSLRAGEDLDLGLRRAFWVDGACISLRHVILSVAGGTGTVDVDRFDSLVTAGGAALPERPVEAAKFLQAALRLWRGPAYVEFIYDDFAAQEIARLDGIDLAAPIWDAVEARFAARANRRPA